MLIDPRLMSAHMGCGGLFAEDDQKGREDDFIWSQTAFPSYLQSRESHKKDVCWEFDKFITAAERKHSHDRPGSMQEEEDFDVEEEDSPHCVWSTIR